MYFDADSATSGLLSPMTIFMLPTTFRDCIEVGFNTYYTIPDLTNFVIGKLVPYTVGQLALATMVDDVILMTPPYTRIIRGGTQKKRRYIV